MSIKRRTRQSRPMATEGYRRRGGFAVAFPCTLLSLIVAAGTPPKSSDSET